MQILADQLEHAQKNLECLRQEIERLVDSDPQTHSVLAISELGPMTVAVLRGELGDLDRFARVDQIVAYVGLDLQVKQSGKWKEQTKLSKRGSGHMRRILYLAALRSIRLPTSSFGIFYHRLVDRGMKKGRAVMAVCTPHLRLIVGNQPLDSIQMPGRAWYLSQAFTLLS